jgi:ketosteroid isomerase-like protein
MVEAVNKNDVDALLTHLDKDIVVTWMDGRVSRGPAEVREYIERMTKGPDRKVAAYTTEVEVDDLTHLYGDTGVAYGHSKDHFTLTDGQDFVANTRWTAALVKKDDAWKLAGLQASVGMFDNPILNIAVRRTAWLAGGVAGVVGLAIGFLGARMLRRRPA